MRPELLQTATSGHLQTWNDLSIYVLNGTNIGAYLYLDIHRIIFVCSTLITVRIR